MNPSTAAELLSWVSVMFKIKYAQYECLSGSLGFRLDVILLLLSAENTTFSHIFDT
jgi:hypothetical protein